MRKDTAGQGGQSPEQLRQERHNRARAARGGGPKADWAEAGMPEAGGKKTAGPNRPAE